VSRTILREFGVRDERLVAVGPHESRPRLQVAACGLQELIESDGDIVAAAGLDLADGQLYDPVRRGSLVSDDGRLDDLRGPTDA